MSPKSLLLLVSLFLLGLTASAQYTEKINTNRPGTSQGAFSVGNNVLQIEGGFGVGKEKHKLFDTKTNTFNFDYTIRYGLLIEQLEINLNGSFRTDGIKQTVGANEEKIRKTDFEYNTIGVKYLIYDPYKKPKDQDSINYDELKSWKERYRFKWKSLIPAVSAYVGMNYVNADNAFTFPTDQTISPKIVLMTQNNWWTSNAGSWVLVTNLVIDKITTDNPAYGWFITSTHTLNNKWAVFGEYQGQKSDFYSDNILRLGGAYLFNNDLQIDANIATNFKDTPSIFRVSVGASYRFDWHYKDEIIEKPGFESGIKEKEGEEELNKKESDSLNINQEFEELENDSLKLEKTPFINDFEDGSHRDAMEQDLDERRTEQRLERERIEKEKQDKKDDKKFQKEERRRLKREAKEAKQAEKARIKAEKEKQKMIEDIDAELDKMEQDDGVDDELKKIDEELKKLEEMEKDIDPEKEKEQKEEEKQAKEEKEDEDVDAAYDKLQKEQEKAKKEDEKRKKKEDKKRLKEEKRKKKEEEKRKKAEEKKKKEEQKKNDENKDEDNGD
ncbi:transporter [uncultured Aquimarina sp.]|uniref:transporter n=1 Tax=uncultured Aquimarina sp. TaxID=575652 RepID=UPI00261ED1E4|nr:transporter [uncultured Aquimarina sp.]